MQIQHSDSTKNNWIQSLHVKSIQVFKWLRSLQWSRPSVSKTVCMLDLHTEYACFTFYAPPCVWEIPRCAMQFWNVVYKLSATFMLPCTVNFPCLHTTQLRTVMCSASHYQSIANNRNSDRAMKLFTFGHSWAEPFWFVDVQAVMHYSRCCGTALVTMWLWSYSLSVTIC